MTASPTTRRYTPDELLELEDADSFELSEDGELQETSMGVYESYVLAELLGAILSFVKASHAGYVSTGDLGFRLFPWKPLRFVRPDAAFVAKGRLSADDLHRAMLTIAPDLVVEVVSPTDRATELEAKIADYLRAGVRLAWVVYPETREVIVHRRDGTLTRRREGDTLDGEDVLPGFSVPVGALFPTLED